MEPSLFPGQRLQAGEPYAAMEPIGDKMFRKGLFPEGKALKVLTYILSQKYLNQQSLVLIFFSFFEDPKNPSSSTLRLSMYGDNFFPRACVIAAIWQSIRIGCPAPLFLSSRIREK